MIRRPPRSTLLSLHDALPISTERFTISFYLTAMLFIVFDIEIVFLYPLAVQLEALGWFGFSELAFFIGILDRKSTRLNSSHANISYAVFCLKKTIPTLFYLLF